jgi:cellulose synthase/poly-beta-1,6-N-acetylglucosamine synthase-like glycosyltransferase
MAESSLQLAVIVPATNRPPHLSACIAAIEASDEAPDELIVVQEPAGAGPAQARNDGAARASAEVIVFVDADVLVHADAFTRIRRWFAENPGLAAVFGAYDDEPSAAGVVSQFRNLLHHDVHEQGRGRAATFWTGLGAIRRDVFTRSGGFDATRFPHPSIEDVELGARLHAGGAWIELDP